MEVRQYHIVGHILLGDSLASPIGLKIKRLCTSNKSVKWPLICCFISLSSKRKPGTALMITDKGRPARWLYPVWENDPQFGKFRKNVWKTQFLCLRLETEYPSSYDFLCLHEFLQHASLLLNPPRMLLPCWDKNCTKYFKVQAYDCPLTFIHLMLLGLVWPKLKPSPLRQNRGKLGRASQLVSSSEAHMKIPSFLMWDVPQVQIK